MSATLSGGLRGVDCSVSYSLGYRRDDAGAPLSQPVQLRSADGSLSFSLTLQNGWDAAVNVGALPPSVVLQLTWLNGTEWATARNVTAPPARACIRAVPSVVLSPPPGVFVGGVAVSFVVAPPSAGAGNGSGGGAPTGVSSDSGGDGYTVDYTVTAGVGAAATTFSGSLPATLNSSSGSGSGGAGGGRAYNVTTPPLPLSSCGVLTVTAVARHPGMQSSPPVTGVYSVVSSGYTIAVGGAAAMTCVGQQSLAVGAVISAAVVVGGEGGGGALSAPLVVEGGDRAVSGGGDNHHNDNTVAAALGDDSGGYHLVSSASSLGGGGGAPQFALWGALRTSNCSVVVRVRSPCSPAGPPSSSTGLALLTYRLLRVDDGGGSFDGLVTVPACADTVLQLDGLPPPPATPALQVRGRGECHCENVVVMRTLLKRGRGE